MTVAFTTGDWGVQCEEDGRRTDPDHNHVNQWTASFLPPSHAGVQYHLQKVRTNQENAGRYWIQEIKYALYDISSYLLSKIESKKCMLNCI